MELKEPIYLSGPMTGIKDFNKSEFEKIENLLRKKGYTKIYNPVKIGENLSKKTNKKLEEISYEKFILEDIKKLKKSKTIVMLKGWQRSKGANIEIVIAKRKGLKIIDTFDLNN